MLSFLFLSRDLTLRAPSPCASSHPYALLLPPFPSSPCPALPSPSPTFEADIQGHPGQRGIDDVAQINLLLLVEVKLPAATRGETERNELLSVEAIQWLQQDRERRWDEKGAQAGRSG